MANRRNRSISLDFNETISTTSIRQKHTKIHSTIITEVQNAIFPHISGNKAFTLFADSDISCVDETTDLILSYPDLQMEY